MKKVVISGSTKLVDKIKDWVTYFEKKGYDVLDYPNYAMNCKEQMVKIYIDYYRNIETSNVFFLMNEDKNGIEGYIGPSAISELTYAVMQNLIHNKGIEIYILKEPSKELNCYTEIRMWLDSGLIKIWERE